MNKISLGKKLLLLTSVLFFASCDKDFNTIGSEIVDNDYFNFTKEELAVTAENFATGPVQTNNLSLNALGTYYNPAFGGTTTTAHFVTQASLPFDNVTVNTNPVVDSVWVYVPYFIGQETGTDANGIRQFELDSVHENTVNKFKLKVYENGYYLGNYNPDNENGIQRFYSDDKDKIETYKLGATSTVNATPVVNGLPLNNGPVAENDQFYFRTEEKIIYKTNGNGLYVDAAGVVLPDADQGDVSKRVIKERLAPGLWLNLNKDYFNERILKANAQELTNNNTFRSYFRGLYFQSEAIAAKQGALALLDFSKGYIKMTYKMDAATDDDNNPATPTAVRLKRSLTLKLGGNTVNFFDTDYALPSGPAGEKLYLKGGNGSAAYIDLFGADGLDEGTTPDQLDALRASNWLINEANLTFYVDQDEMYPSTDAEKTREPNRIYLYDYNNKKPIIDFYADGSTNGSNPKYNKRGFGGIIEKEPGADGKGIKYKIRITDYLKSCIEKDSTNFRLGLVVTENINTITNAYLKPAAGQQPSQIVPLSSVINPLGTILHGPNSADPEKRLKLEIYYTKPD
ncbi:hypothetical protein FSS13T_25570 [Flavobacterium saliperosum S13]|uniref:DUF4270 domain-containing protein n=2 Tax=Flavobacterium saliperosum TaxID=329186 RepID=A0A1G4W6C5_9FLAO|nr:DUF4270 domain-containing protein [Flavobacterium saliperosum]ESU22557.1 hypothetical protein FSS13T_25570 [Flavobacterium saliperosum S13]SCX17062.1 protein of unknown function [Flavobacterium saliperosum]